MKVTLTLLVAFLGSSVSCALATSCEQYFKKLENGVLSNLIGLRVKDADGKYAFGLCTDAITDGGSSSSSGAGVVQLSGGSGGGGGHVVHGRWGQFYASAGHGLIELVYMGGDSASKTSATDGNCSSSSSSGAALSAHIVLVCDSSERSGTFQYVGRVSLNNNKGGGGGCYSLFQLLHRRLCSLDGSGGGGLPPAAIALIVLLSLFCAYLLVGAAIQRFAFGRRGLEMVPNYGAWRRLGDALADGCDFVCRSGGDGDGGDPQAARERQYQPVTDNHATSLAEEDDENLLPA